MGNEILPRSSTWVPDTDQFDVRIDMKCAMGCVNGSQAHHLLWVFTPEQRTIGPRGLRSFSIEGRGQALEFLAFQRVHRFGSDAG